MAAELMDGTTVAERILQRTAARAAEFETKHGRAPTLATVLVGDDPASHTYVKMKVNRCRRVGIRSERHAAALVGADELHDQWWPVELGVAPMSSSDR